MRVILFHRCDVAIVTIAKLSVKAITRRLRSIPSGDRGRFTMVLFNLLYNVAVEQKMGRITF